MEATDKKSKLLQVMLLKKPNKKIEKKVNLISRQKKLLINGRSKR